MNRKSDYIRYLIYAALLLAFALSLARCGA